MPSRLTFYASSPCLPPCLPPIPTPIHSLCAYSQCIAHDSPSCLLHAYLLSLHPPMPSRPPLHASLPCLLRGYLLLCMLCKLSVHASSPCLPFLLAPCLLPMPNPNIPARPILNASPQAGPMPIFQAYTQPCLPSLPSITRYPFLPSLPAQAYPYAR
jgi:hypothetical protein